MKVNLSVDSDDPVPLCIDSIAGVLEKELDLLWSSEFEKPQEAEISITFLSSQEMREQNVLFRNIDEPTDVLSFPLWEGNGRFLPHVGIPILPLGDILVCPEQVSLNGDDVCLMIAHGFLHLLAFDHDTPEKEALMWKLQDRITEELRCAFR